MSKIQLSGIFLAVVMVCGSIPLGFSEPLRVQLESGLETNQIQCDNSSHVLVQRTNGKLACISEKSAERMNWEIIETNISLVEYDYPLTAKHKEVTYSQNSEPLEVPFIKTELQISNLPKLLESAEITVSVYDNLSQTTTYADDLEEWLYIRISNNFEIMSGLDDFTILHYEDLDFTGYKKLVSVQKDQVVEEFKITVVAFGVGEASITSGEWPPDSSFELVIGETETLLKDDYYKKYPKALAAKQASIEAANLAEEEALLDQGCYFVENFGMFCPPTNEELEEMRANEDDETIDSEEELRAYLKADGASDEEIEAIVREAYPKASTQSFSFLQPAYAQSNSFNISGRLVTTTSQLTLTSDSSTIDERIHDANVCAYDTENGGMIHQDKK